MYAQAAIDAAHPDVREIAPLMVKSLIQRHGIAGAEALIHDQISDPARTPRQRAAWMTFANELEGYVTNRCFSDEYRRSRQYISPLYELTTRKVLPADFAAFARAWRLYLALNIGWEE